MKFCKTFLLLIIAPFAVLAQSNTRPKLVVGIVVDQMRNEYIYRFWPKLGNGGFKRLVNEGTYFRNTHYNYVPTYTGPGHASIYTGTTPRYHGIIANEWYDKHTKKEIGCVNDTSVKSVGVNNNSGKASAKNLLATTIGDELKLNSGGKSKVFGVALKDRSAILPAGHAANAAYWMDEKNGQFITSSAYMDKLPDWLNAFNAENKSLNYLKDGWSLLYPPDDYIASLPDENNFEAHPFNDRSTFPYDFSNYIAKGNLSVIRGTPHGNSITKDLAMRLILNEQLGKDDYCDLLSVSFSSPDIVAHSFGPRSVEVQDVYLRLDKDLEELFSYLDITVGKNNYVVFLTADHGGAEVSSHLSNLHIPSGNVSDKSILQQLKKSMFRNFGDSTLISNVSNEQVFLDEEKIKTRKLSIAETEDKVVLALESINGIAEAYSATKLRYQSYENREPRNLLSNGYHHQRSGNVLFTLQPGWMNYGVVGTTHGATYNYDTHVPLIFYGAGIRHKQTLDFVTITQIAPTLCELLGISQPNACFSDILTDLFE